MNTPAHLIFGLAAFAKPNAGKVTAAALAGALIPDLSLYLLAGVHLLIIGTDPQVVFGRLYFSDGWQAVFRVDNSIVLWGIGVAIAVALRSAWAVALCGAALLHLGLDFLLHHDDGRAHFWPVSSWIFESPVSYWDRNHYGNIIAPIETAMSLIFCVILWFRFDWPDGFQKRTARLRAVFGSVGEMPALPVAIVQWIIGSGFRGVIFLLALLQLIPGLIWLFVFAT